MKQVSKIVVLPASGGYRVQDHDFSNIRKSLHILQKEVGGYIESVPVSRNVAISSLRIICNEEGFLKRLPLNTVAGSIAGHIICGDAVLVDTDSGDFTGINERDLSCITDALEAFGIEKL